MKRIIIVVCLMLVMILSTGCSLQNLFEDEYVRSDLDSIVDAIESEDMDNVYDRYFKYNIMGEVDENEFKNSMKQMIAFYKGEKVSTEFQNVNMQTINGNTIKEVMYLVETTESAYYVKLSYYKNPSNTYNLVYININEAMDYIVNDKLSDYTFKNWTLLALNVVSYGIMILALILCIKTKIKLKPLWIILILIQVGVTITDFPNKYQINYSFIQLLGISQFLLYAHGGTFTSVFIHVFAVIFLILRKRLNNTYLMQQELKEMKSESTESIKDK